MKAIQEIYTFGKSVLSENGQGSFGRVSAAAVVICTLAWVSFVVIHTGALPDLSGATLFLTSGASATYGANKIAGVLKKEKPE